MKHGYIRVASATARVSVANPEANANEIIAQICEAEKKGANITLFPELCITGYTCADLFFDSALQSAAKDALLKILKHTEDKNTIIAVGLPIMFYDNLYSCTAVVYKGELLGVCPKRKLTQSEKRFFSEYTGENGETELFGRKCPFGAELVFCCEDMQSFTFGIEAGNQLYSPAPLSASLCASGANIILSPLAEYETVSSEQKRYEGVKNISERLRCAYALCLAGAGESTTDGAFMPYSITAEDGEVIARSSGDYESGFLVSDTDTAYICAQRVKNKTYEFYENKCEKVFFSYKIRDIELSRRYDENPFLPVDAKAADARCEKILEICAAGLCKRISHTRAKKLVIGISGGLDSCMALLVSIRALEKLSRPATDILAISMPCFGTSGRTKNNAQELCACLGTEFSELDIKKSVLSHFEDIGHDGKVPDVTFENAQARYRTLVLMDLANKYSGMVVGTGDLSELALGWATYNGDHMSMYGVNASIPKTVIKYAVRYFGKKYGGKLGRILTDIADTPVSPELLPATNGEIAQKTEDLVGPYELHDFFLYHTLKSSFSPKKIQRIAKTVFEGKYDEKTVEKWQKIFVRRFFTQQFKRSCLPDGPRVGSVCLSPRGALCMPSDADFSLWNELTR